MRTPCALPLNGGTIGRLRVHNLNHMHATIIRGRTVMRDDEIIATGQGEPVRFMETFQKEG